MEPCLDTDPALLDVLEELQRLEPIFHRPERGTRREDFERAKAAMEAAGFVHGSTMDVEFFLDGPDAKVRDAVHVLMAGEKVRPDYASATPDVAESHRGPEFCVIDLQPLVEMKLNSWRDKDRMHLRDLIELGLVDQSWTNRFTPKLAERLQELLDNPDG